MAAVGSVRARQRTASRTSMSAACTPPTAEMAVKHARDIYTRRMEGVSLWVVPSAEIIASDPATGGRCSNRRRQGLSPPDVLFDPRRHQAHLMRELAPAMTSSTNSCSHTCCVSATSPLILGQRLSEWCGHAPVLEVDLSLANRRARPDRPGDASRCRSSPARSKARAATRMRSPSVRDVLDFRNCLLVEQPNGDFAQTRSRASSCFDAGKICCSAALTRIEATQRIAAIAAKAVKEVAYHARARDDWMVRLGDGTEESRKRGCSARSTTVALHRRTLRSRRDDRPLIAAGVAADARALRRAVAERTSPRPRRGDAGQCPGRHLHADSGGQAGRHTEHLGHLLAEMQFLQRAYPGARW